MAAGPEISKEIREALIECARAMRKSPTEAEALLWGHLRQEQLMGFKFRRQHIIRNFIVDFYCPVRKLIIELDGPIHLTQLDYDQEREKYLRAMGYQILRFTNQEVMRDIEGVLAKIRFSLIDIQVGGR